MRKKKRIVSLLKPWILAAASALGYFRVFAFFNRHKVGILFYHGVSSRESFPGIENHDGKHTRISLFRKHLAFFSRRYRVLPLPDVLDALRAGTPLPPYSLVITFDDGYENNVTAALPCLQSAGLTAAFFLTASLIGTDESLWVDQLEQMLNDPGLTMIAVSFGHERRTLGLETVEDRKEADRLIRAFCKKLPDAEKQQWLASFFRENGFDPSGASGDHRLMTWEQARELQASGMTVGSHTLSHAIVTRLGPEEMEREIAGGRRACEEKLGAPCDTFAYPNGAPGDFDEASEAILRRLGFSCGLTTVQGLIAAGDNPYTLKRIGVGNHTSVTELESHLSGHTWLALRILRRLRR